MKKCIIITNKEEGIMKLIKKEYSFSITEMAVFKLVLISGGIVIGSFWAEKLINYWLLFAGLWFIGAVYIVYVTHKK